MSTLCTGETSRSANLCGILLGLAALGFAATAVSSEAASVEEAVNGLVAEALLANLEIESAGAGVAQRLAALEQARALYLPSLDFNARYTRADGGRTIDFPVGDLLNPVYASLNQITGNSRFPVVQNQQINFQRTREQDTRLSLTQPLYDARISAGRLAAQAQYDASAAGRIALTCRIQRDMREAYYRWLQARAQIGIFDATLELATENRRVNESLLRNGKITRDLLFRAEADQLEVQQSQLGAQNAERLAQSYVNLIRNAPFDRALPSVALENPDVERLRNAMTTQPALGLTALQETAVHQRYELRQLDAIAAAAAAGEQLARAAFKPRLAFAFDIGAQGETYALTSADRYLLASVVLKFNFFAGGADQAGVASARAAERQARANRSMQEQQIRFQVQQALQDFEFTQASLSTAAKRVEAAAGAFRIASRKRDLGQINQAEFIDSRRAMTDAQSNLNVTRFSALSSLAELQYALGADSHHAPPQGQP
ncbi:MAG: TolC family protein [Pseudomonadota bacterium]|nr:TolC family protein [Pseudomonadota bacterium]